MWSAGRAADGLEADRLRERIKLLKDRLRGRGIAGTLATSAAREARKKQDGACCAEAVVDSSSVLADGILDVVCGGNLTLAKGNREAGCQSSSNRSKTSVSKDSATLAR